MSSKDTKDHDAPIDVRSLERDLKRGKMTRKEHERALKSLPDVKAKAMSMADASPAPGGGTVESDDLDDDDIDDEDEDEAAGDTDGEAPPS
jgi:hypothetical protein